MLPQAECRWRILLFEIPELQFSGSRYLLLFGIHSTEKNTIYTRKQNCLSQFECTLVFICWESWYDINSIFTVMYDNPDNYWWNCAYIAAVIYIWQESKSQHRRCIFICSYNTICSPSWIGRRTQLFHYLYTYHQRHRTNPWFKCAFLADDTEPSMAFDPTYHEYRTTILIQVENCMSD